MPDRPALDRPTLEIERTWDVDAEISLPDWGLLPGVAAVGAPEVRDLDARYYDTPDAALARRRIAVRRRTGGPDEGWHVKVGATGEGRHEWHFPLTALGPDGVADIPAALRETLERLGGSVASLTPLARIRNHRTAFALRDDAGLLVAEFVDDRVEGTDVRQGRRTAWREWELELGTAPADTAAFFAAADALAKGAGARDASVDSKLARALGL